MGHVILGYQNLFGRVGNESFMRYFCIVGFGLFARIYRFPFYTCLDKMLERWGQRRVPRGHGLAIVGNLYSLFSSKRCVCRSLLLYYSSLLSEGWILVSRVDDGKEEIIPIIDFV
jgi:hypothetical protein